jgi:tRNA pseudouridine synthase 10
MLGSGRPFVVSLLEPRLVFSVPDAATLEANINSSTDLIQVRGLKLVSRQFFEELKASEEDKLKVYSAVVWSSRLLTPSDIEQLNTQPSIDLQQKTPVRVLHRRSQLTRQRSILSIRARLLTSHVCEVRLISTAGTYIKEFVHGDLGRTQPNLGSLLGSRTDILQLDVLGLGWAEEELQALLEG